MLSSLNTTTAEGDEKQAKERKLVRGWLKQTKPISTAQSSLGLITFPHIIPSSPTTIPQVF
jgi:hypothetical protein